MPYPITQYGSKIEANPALNRYPNFLNAMGQCSDGVVKIGSVLWYLDILSDEDTIQAYQSTDSGATWTMVASVSLFAFSSQFLTDAGWTYWLSGTTIWLALSANTPVTFQIHLWCIPFDTLTGSWGTAYDSGLVGNLFSPPTGSGSLDLYSAFHRSDNTTVLTIDNLVSGQRVFGGIIFDEIGHTFSNAVLIGSITPPFSDGLIFLGSSQSGDEVAMVITNSGIPTSSSSHAAYYWIATISALNVGSAATQIVGGSGVASGGGYVAYIQGAMGTPLKATDGFWYIPVCLGSPPGNNGNERFGILTNASGSWVLTSALDTLIPWFTPALFQVGTQLLAIYNAATSQTSDYVSSQIRFGYVDLTSFSSTGAWTWSTIFDLASPSFPVSDLVSPYRYKDQKGAIMHAIQGPDDVIRLDMRLADSTGKFESCYLLSIGSSGIGPACRYYGH